MTLDVSNATTRVNIVDIDWIYPLSWNNKEVTECAFGSVEYIDGNKYKIKGGIIMSKKKLHLFCTQMTKQQIILRPKSRTTEYFFHNQEENLYSDLGTNNFS